MSAESKHSEGRRFLVNGHDVTALTNDDVIMLAPGLYNFSRDDRGNTRINRADTVSRTLHLDTKGNRCESQKPMEPTPARRTKWGCAFRVGTVSLSVGSASLSIEMDHPVRDKNAVAMPTAPSAEEATAIPTEAADADSSTAAASKQHGAPAPADVPDADSREATAPLSAMLSAPDLARLMEQPAKRVESFLRRFRESHPDCYSAVDNPRRNEPRYLYRTADVWPALQQQLRTWESLPERG